MSHSRSVYLKVVRHENVDSIRGLLNGRDSISARGRGGINGEVEKTL